MPQLELFSIVREEKDTLKKNGSKEKVSSEEPLQVTAGNDRPIFAEPPETPQNSDAPGSPKKLVDETSGHSNPVVFSDGKISVRIKNKEAKTPAQAGVTEQPAEKIKTSNLRKRGRKSLKQINAEADLIEVPGDEILFQKQYYPISTVAEWFKVNTSLLRFWENEFDILKPRKNRKGDRMFRPEDVKNLQLIYHLLRHRKYTIDGAKEFLKSNKGAADVQLQLTQTLQKFRLFLLELKANLQG